MFFMPNMQPRLQGDGVGRVEQLPRTLFVIGTLLSSAWEVYCLLMPFMFKVCQ